jgi:hypothetical protein
MLQMQLHSEAFSFGSFWQLEEEEEEEEGEGGWGGGETVQ